MNPLSAGACRHAGCEKTKASRPAVTPQLRPQSKVSLPVAAFVTLSGSDATRKVRMSLPAIAPSRHHRQKSNDR